MKKEQKIYLNLLNVTACLCVVYMHCNGIVHVYSDTAAWRQSMVVETLAYWAVPVFFMISGATLMNYRERYDTRTYLKKRFMRVGIPFFVWTLLNVAWKSTVGQITIEWSFSWWVSLFFNCRAENIYWFFIPLFSVYFSIPVLSLLKDNRNILKYMLAVGGITYSILPVMCSVAGIDYNAALSFPLTGGYILYVILGYILDTESSVSDKKRYIIYAAAFLCAGIRYFSTVLMAAKTGEVYKMFWGYLNFPAVGLSVGVFVFFRYMNWDKFLCNKRAAQMLSEMSSASFGIYLIHMIVMNMFYSYGVDTYGIKWRILGAPIVYFICLSIVICSKKLPGINRIVRLILP